jgi:hypothetical protein
MKPIFFTIILLALPVSAFADWSNTGISPNLSPNQGQPIQHAVHMNPAQSVRIEQRHQLQPAQQAQPVRHYTPAAVNRPQAARQDRPVNQVQVTQRRMPVTPGYFRRDADYYGHARVAFPYSDIDTDPVAVVPDGFEAVIVDGQAYFYNDGVFYQQVAGQLAAIPPVLGAVVDSIPNDYQIVMADGTHYLFTRGVFYKRVDEGFEVVEPPVSDQE